MAAGDLLKKFSYRYTQVELNSFLSPLRYLKASMALLLKNNSNRELVKNSIFTYESQTQFLEMDTLYLSGITGTKPLFIFRDNLPSELNIFSKIINVFFLCLTFLFIFPIAVLSSDKAKKSLVLLELAEALLLAKTLKKHACKELMIISAYEKDIVFLSYFLNKKLGIKITLIPSSNPVSVFYKYVICDTFIFTAPFQEKEYAALKQNWFVNDTKSWPPFEYYSVKLNKGQVVPQQAVTIGFMSSASALREYLKHTNHAGNKDFLAERSLIEGLSNFFKANNQYTLLVYLHPLEKRNAENLAFAKQYYENIFGGNVAYAPLDQPSKSTFDLCGLAVSGFSSTQVERLYGGYKTLFAPMGYLNNYFSDPRLDAISVQNSAELEKSIASLMITSDEDFFKNFNLEDYRWDAYKNLNTH